jgi:PAS domain S-box-containing protein
MSRPTMTIQTPLASESSLSTFRDNLLWHLQDAVVTLDQNGQICFWNPAAEKLLGHAPTDVVGRHYQEVFQPVNQTSSDLALWLENQERLAPLEAIWTGKSGQPISLTVQGFNYQGEEQTVLTLLLQAAPSSPLPEQRAQDMMDWLRCNRNMDAALGFAVKKLGELIAADTCRIWLYEPESDKFLPLRHEFLAPSVPIAEAGRPPRTPPNLTEPDVRGKTLYIPDTQRWGAALEAYQATGAQASQEPPGLRAAWGARSLLRIPLIHAGENYGFLQAECLEEANPWGEQSIVQAQQVTDLVSSIIHQARREELGQAVLQQRARQQEMLAVLSQRALLDPNFQVFMELAAVMISKTLGVARCRILERPDQPEGNFRPHAAVGYDRQWSEPSTGRPMNSLAAYTLACNQPVIAEDMGVETRFAPDGPLSGDRVKSAAAVLICKPQGVYGVLEVASFRHRAFQPHDISFLQAVANVLGQVAERSQAQQRAHQDQDPYQLVLDAVGYGCLTVNLKNGEFHSSERFCALLGRSLEFTKSPMDLVLAWIHPEDRQRAKALFSPDSGRGEQPLHMPLRLQHAWGHFVTLQFQALIFHDEAGKPIRVAAICQTMTAFSALSAGNGEAHLETVKRLSGLQQLMETNTLGFMLWRQDGTVLHSNQALLSLLGYRNDDVTAGRLDWRKCTPPESATKDEQALRQIFSSGFALPYEKQYLTRDGQVVEVLQGTARLPDHPTEGMSFVLDVTHKNQEIRRLQSALEREQLRHRIITLLGHALEPDLSLNTVAEELGAFFQADRCTIVRWSDAPTATAPFQITKLAQYRASEEVESVTLEHIPAIEFRRYFQGSEARWIHFPNLYTFTQALQSLSRTNPGIAKLSSTVSHYWKTYRIQSYFSLDIQFENNTYGSLSLHQCAYSKRWPQEDLEFLEAIAHHLGRVIHQDAHQRQQRQASQEVARQHALLKNILETQRSGQMQAEIPRLLQEALQAILTHSESGTGFIAEISATASGQPQVTLRAEIAPYNDASTPIRTEILQQLAEQLQTTLRPPYFSLELEAVKPPHQNIWALPLVQGTQITGMVGLTTVDDPSQFKVSEALNTYVSIVTSLLAAESQEKQKARDWEWLQADMKLAQYQASQLERSNHELEQFALIAAHDLQTPLRKVIVFSDFLKSSIGEQLSLESADFLVRIQKSTRKMQSLIKTLLFLSRINHQDKPFEPVNLGQTIQEVLIDLEESRKEVQGSVYVSGTITIDGDHIQLYQVLQNLIGNALKFQKSDQAPIVSISAQAVDEQTCEIKVKDNGIGFDEKNLNRIFKVYERLHGENEYEGTGLGLAIVQKIIERHCGTISAQSAPGQGATFTIRLPIHQSQNFSKKNKATR